MTNALDNLARGLVATCAALALWRQALCVVISAMARLASTSASRSQLDRGHERRLVFAAAARFAGLYAAEHGIIGKHHPWQEAA